MKFKLPKIPTLPGCYLFKDSKNSIIYIGKAKNLKKRVSSYFSNKNTDEKTLSLISNIKDVDFIVTNNETEAFILENNLIKKHKPKYNIDLKDSKRYAYIEVTSEEVPRIKIGRDKNVKGKIFGPFTSASTRDNILYTLNRTFMLRTCKRLPKKECLRYSIGLCSAPCVGKISKSVYLKDVHSAMRVLKGETKQLVKKLVSEMKSASEKKNYETALKYRSQIESLNSLDEKQRVERQKKYNEDIINYLVKDSKVYLMVFNVYKGTLLNKEEFFFDYSDEFIEEFLVRYYEGKEIPKEIILPEKVSEGLREYLKVKRGKKVNIVVPERGELKSLLLLVRKNIELTYFGEEEKLEELKKILNLEDLPRVIECFDVSHFGGSEIVGSMVQFRNGLPDKSNYRRFKVRSFEEIDDFSAIKEIVYRRYYRLKKEKSRFPDLVLIDGGLPQISAGMEALKQLGVKVPIISLAKREEEIYLPDKNTLLLSKKNKGLLFLIRIRDEAHRFAVSYQKIRRRKRFFGGTKNETIK